MARVLRDERIGSREARQRLKPRGKPYFRQIEPGLHLGYRKPRGRKGRPAVAGKWVTRTYLGSQQYIVQALASADDFSDSNGTTVINFKEAQDRARERLAGGAKSGPLTVRMALDAYYEKLENEGRGMAAIEARQRLTPHLAHIADIRCDDLQAKDLRNWLAAVARAPARVRTAPGEKQQHRTFDHADAEAVRQRRASANRTLTSLKAALNHAYKEGHVAAPGAWTRVAPFGQVEVARVRYLTVAEATRLINASAPTFRPMVRAALLTGARYGELTRLLVADFNNTAGTLTIRLSKSGKARHVVLTEEGTALFQQLAAGRAGDAVLIPRPDGRPWQRSMQQAPIREACEHANIKPAIGFHILRHTWASLSIMAGMPLMVCAKNLGHVDVSMVEKHYGHLAPSYIADEVRRAAPRFGIEQASTVTAIR
jgi:integrase